MIRPDVLTADEQTLANATKRAIQAADGLEVCSRETGLSTSQLSRCCSPFQRDSLTLRDAVTIESISHGKDGHPHILNALARIMGGVFVPLPVGNTDHAGLVQSVMDLTAELGDVAQSITSGLRDNEFTPGEAQVALEQLQDLDRASAALRMKLNAFAQTDEKR